MSAKRASPSEGLPRHPSLDDRFDPAVRIVDYDPAWPALAEAERRRIEEALDAAAVRLEHVGSTAVLGLASKPVLDLQMSVDSIEPRERYIEPLERLGYLFVPDPESPDYHLFARPRERPRTITCMFANPGATTSSGTSPFGTSCGCIPARRRGTRP
jgi:GrpB-like predicted nucleotidyltransferase (UPF0157 family)